MKTETLQKSYKGPPKLTILTNRAMLISKHVFKTAGTIIKNKSTQNDRQMEHDLDNEVISDHQWVPVDFNLSFSKVKSHDGLHTQTHQESEIEIPKLIGDIVNKKSNMILSHMSLWLLLKCSKGILKPSVHLANLFFSTGVSPSALKMTKTTPFVGKVNKDKHVLC